MIILRSPKGWTGPKEVDGLKTEGFWRSHQVPLSGIAENPEHLKLLEDWLQELPARRAVRRGGRARRRDPRERRRRAPSG